jgi:hypothetical protein
MPKQYVIAHRLRPLAKVRSMALARVPSWCSPIWG